MVSVYTFHVKLSQRFFCFPPESFKELTGTWSSTKEEWKRSNIKQQHQLTDTKKPPLTCAGIQIGYLERSLYWVCAISVLIDLPFFKSNQVQYYKKQSFKLRILQKQGAVLITALGEN